MFLRFFVQHMQTQTFQADDHRVHRSSGIEVAVRSKEINYHTSQLPLQTLLCTIYRHVATSRYVIWLEGTSNPANSLTKPLPVDKLNAEAAIYQVDVEEWLLYVAQRSVGGTSSSMYQRTDDETLCHECDLTSHITYLLLLLPIRVSTTGSCTCSTLTHSSSVSETEKLLALSHPRHSKAFYDSDRK